jgi:hypothetical protein
MEFDKMETKEERLHPVLSNVEVLEARKKARARLDAERKKAALKAVEEAELERLREEEGMAAEGTAGEMVTITVDLPEFGNRLVVNSRPYWHGHSYTVPRHVSDSLRETMFRMWRHQETEIEGRNLTQAYRRPHNTGVSGRGAIVNPPGAH